ncbi:membrane protein [Lysobacter helvus]|uniref:Membrane protein n=2 Tax=Lysobacteraceae TaxID=32033 RepID=A0ABN6FT01_9GAMM|nr:MULTISPECIES: PH domain-containing protein [Lysobacter]BCT92039.1 membrane protein [Lysobacter caseinilyticus]BCT95192.1 membrane protein [Lysobacter helvus]
MTPSESRRLHPWSWLFVLLHQMRQFILPLIATFFFKGDRDELWPLIGVGILTLTSALQYLTYRWQVGTDGLTIRSGWLNRQRREIPFARIHNVVVEQSMLHRVFGVAEVRLESAGGDKPEASMRVLRLDDALALERLVRHRGATQSTEAANVEATAPAPTTLLAMDVREVLRYGLISNRGLLLLAGAYAASMQFSPRLLENLFESWVRSLFGFADAHHFGAPTYALALVSLAVVLIALLRMLSIGSALLQYYGFRLSEDGPRLTVERGLLARTRSSASRRRLQAWTMQEGLLHRLLHRRTLKVDTAGAGTSEHGQRRQRAFRELAPIATPEKCDALIEHLLPPDAGWGQLDWHGTHWSTWVRAFLPGVFIPIAIATALTWNVGPIGLLVLLWLPWAAFVARKHASHSAYAINDRIVAVRGGWWSKHWRFAELDKLQALSLSRSPFDRPWGTASVWLDTAGAGSSTPLRVACLPEAEARALVDRLAHVLARRKLRW